MRFDEIVTFPTIIFDPR